MKYISAIIIVWALTASASFGQSERGSIDSILIEIAEAKYFKNSKRNTGMSAEDYSLDSQYLRFEELKNRSSKEELRLLLYHENNIIVAYSWKAFLILEPNEALRFLLANSDSLEKRGFTVFLNDCQGYHEQTLARYMTNELYDQLIAKGVKLSADEIISFLIFKENMMMKRITGTETKDF